MVDVKKLKSLAEKLSVLYVEDDIQLRQETTTYLTKIFNRVDTADDGQMGLEMYRENGYDIVITDILMPHMDGLEMTTEIKKLNEEQEVIIISAYSDPQYFTNAIHLGVNGYIIKPINYEQINATLYKSAVKLTRFKENVIYKEHLEELVEERTKKVFEMECDRVQNFEQTLMAFVEMIEDRDTYTGGHSQRVANYSRMIAKQMGYSDEECDLIYRAGILHDIGKIATPDTVLLKPGKLNPIEYKLIKEHVKVSHELLSKIPMYKEIAEIIIYHHERYDGSGYPTGAQGNEIPTLARIMIVADAFDAMTTNRIYKGRKNVEGAIDELRMLSGIQFHPDVVQSACEVLTETTIPDSASQLPTTEIEQERFAYFYRDQVTNAYNAEYLDFILHRNEFEREYHSVNVLYLHNFSQFNQLQGWAEGDRFLNSLVDYLNEQYPDILMFRIHGDDFILISKEDLEIDMNQFDKLDLFSGKHIGISRNHFDIEKEQLFSRERLEELI
jgi:putative nucleotidyltransferase with HDIG domain